MQHLTPKNFSNVDEFRDYFVKYGRGDNFNYEQFEILFNHLNDCCPDDEIDVIGICCDCSGYDSIEEAIEDLGYEDERDLERNCGILTGENGNVIIMH